MLTQIADLRLCTLMALCPYVPVPLCPYALMSASLCLAHFCLRPHAVDHYQPIDHEGAPHCTLSVNIK